MYILKLLLVCTCLNRHRAHNLYIAIMNLINRRSCWYLAYAYLCVWLAKASSV